MARLGRLRLAIPLWLAVSVLLAVLHAVDVEYGPQAADARARHEQIVTLSADTKAPWCYRIGSPVLAEATRRVLAPVLGAQALPVSYVAWRAVFTFGFLVLFQLWLEAWVSPAWAFGGTALAAALHPATFRFYWFQPDSPPDLFVWTAAALATVTGADLALYPLVFLGTINRETAGFALLVHAALRWGKEPWRRLAERLFGLFLCWLVPFLGVHLVVGLRPWAVNVSTVLYDNAEWDWAGYALLFAGPWLLLAFVGWSRRPVELRRLYVALLTTYLPLQLVFGRIREVRLLLPLALAALPLALLALRDTLEEQR